MALRALDGQAENALADAVHAVDQPIGAELLRIHAALLVEHGIAEETGGHALVLGGVGEEVAGNLLDEELVVREISIHGPHHPVAIGPDKAALVLLKAVGIRVARGIEPLASPFLPVMRRAEQLFHHALVGSRGPVGQEGIHLGGRGSQSGKVKVNPSQQRDAIGLGRRGEPLAIQPGEDEGIQRRAHPIGVPHGRLGGTFRRLERPVVRRLVHLGGGRPGRPLVDPIPEQPDLRGGQLVALLGHGGDFTMRARDHLDQQRRVGLAGDDGRPVIPALEQRRPVIQTQGVLRALGSVAAHARGL